MYRSTPTKPASCQLLAAGFVVLELPIIAALAIGTLVTRLLLRAAQAVKWASGATHNLHRSTANGIRLRPHRSMLASQAKTR